MGDIDEGVFKYVYIRVYLDSEENEDEREEKDIVRGYNFAEYHADVYDKTESEITGAGWIVSVLVVAGLSIGHKTNLSRFMDTVWDLAKLIMQELWKFFRQNIQTQR